MISKSYPIVIILLFFFISLSLTTYCYGNMQTTSGDYSPNIRNSGILFYTAPSSINEPMQHLSIQYMRAFDSKKVPLFMKYVIARDVNSTRVNASKEFQEFWHEKWKKPLLPLTNDLNWNYTVDNWETLDKIYGEQSNEIGFLFIIVENKSACPVFDINLEYLVYEKKFIVNNKININNGGKYEGRNIACLNPGEAFIMLLGAYKSNLDGMPEYYLSYFQQPINLHYILNGKQLKQSVREPYGLNAARILLPKNWMSMRAWIGQ